MVSIPPHQYFSIESTKKLDTKTKRVKRISSLELSLLINAFCESDRIYDYWYNACVSVIKGDLRIAPEF